MKKAMQHKRLISLILLAALAFNVLSISAAEIIPEQTEQPNVTIDGEILDKRDIYEKHFENEDGSISAVSYANPIHYKDNSGKWQDVDNTLTSMTDNLLDGITQMENKDNPYVKIKFAKKAKDDKLLSLKANDYKMDISIDGIAKNTPAKVIPTDESLDQNGKKKDRTKLTKMTSQLVYEKALPNTDLKYTINGNNVKEDIILKSVPTYDKIVYNIQVNDLLARVLEDNTVIFYNKATPDDAVFVITAPFMYDSADTNKYSFDFTVELATTKKGYTVTMKPNMDWLKSKDRVYPVTIDPIVSTNPSTSWTDDTYVHENDHIGTHEHNTATNLRVGNDSYGTNRIFIRIKSRPTIPTNSVINRATLNLKFASGTTSASDLEISRVRFAWSPSTYTWLNGYDSDVVYFAVSI